MIRFRHALLFFVALAVVGFARPAFANLIQNRPTGETVFDNGGAPWPFFSQVAAINYDNGGQGVGYNVPSPNPSCPDGTSYRPDAVNLKTSVAGAPAIPFQIGCTQAHNSYNYTINISQSGPYQITLQLADTSLGGSWDILIDGVIVANVPTPNTGSFDTFAPATSGPFSASLGNHKLTLAWGTGDTNFNVAGDILTWQGSQAAATMINSVGMSCGNSCGFVGGTAGTVGTAQAVMSTGSFAGSWSLRTSGTDNFGTTCNNYSGGFTINSSTGVVSNGAIANGSYPGNCLVATQGGAGGSPFAQAVTFTGSSVSPPAPAVAAGFTSLVFAFDFTDPANSNVNTWLAADPSSPFDASCPNPGPANPKWWMLGIGGQIASAPCSAVSIVSDGGGQVLREHWDTSYVPRTGTTSTVGISMAPYSSSSGVYGSPFVYTEAVLRTDDAAGVGDATFYNGVGGPQTSSFGAVEYDSLEIFGPNRLHVGNIYQAGGCPGCLFNTVHNFDGAVGIAGFNAGQYHKYAMRVTGNGTNSLFNCAWIDDVPQGCVADNPGFMRPQDYAGEWLAEVLTNAGPGNNPSASPINVYWKYFRIWSCASWQSSPGACTTSNPNP